MRQLVQIILCMVATVAWAPPMIVIAQSTPEVIPEAESDRLWGGNFVDRLPSCDGDDLCLAALTQSDRGDEYYYGVIQNNSDGWVDVSEVTVTLFDPSGEVAAIGDSLSISPGVVSPGGHALILVTVAGEFISEYTAEAQFEFEPGTGGTDGYGVPLQVDSASVRGTAILGEFTNTSDYEFNTMYAEAMCFADDGRILYEGSGNVSNGPYTNGDADRFAIELYGRDCDNFVVVAWGSPY